METIQEILRSHGIWTQQLEIEILRYFAKKVRNVCPECGEPEPVLHCEKCGFNFNNDGQWKNIYRMEL